MPRYTWRPHSVNVSTTIVIISPGQLAFEWETFADGDATPSVTGGLGFKTANTGATTITDFDDPNANGQQIHVLIQDANTIIQDESNGSNIRLQGGQDYTDSVSGDVLSFLYDGSKWEEQKIK